MEVQGARLGIAPFHHVIGVLIAEDVDGTIRIRMTLVKLLLLAQQVAFKTLAALDGIYGPVVVLQYPVTEALNSCVANTRQKIAKLRLGHLKQDALGVKARSRDRRR